MFFLGAAIGLVVSVFSVVVSDVGRIVGAVVGLIMYITPVIYTTDFEHPVLRLMVRYNLLSYLIAACRDILTVGKIQAFGPYLVVTGITFILFMISLRLFYVSEALVAEKI